MTTKRIEVSGRVFLLAPLTLGQVEHLLNADVPIAERVWLPITDSLTNAGVGFDLPELKEFLDYQDFVGLHDAVLALNDLKQEEASDSSSEQDPLDFPYLRARLAASCGWTFLEADRQPFFEILRLFEIWADEAPPLERSFAAFVGFKSKPTGAEERSRRGNGGTSSRDELVNFTGQWGGDVHHSTDNLPSWMQASLVADGFLKFKSPGEHQEVDVTRPPGLSPN